MNIPKLKINYNENKDPKILGFFTDGSTSSNGKRNSTGGYAYICVNGYLKNKVLVGNLATEHNLPPTNIKCEAKPIIYILELLKNTIESQEWTKCEIYTDSMFWIDMFNKYMPNWEKKNINFDTKKNPNLTKHMWKLWKDITLKKEVNLIFTPSHNKQGGSTSQDPYVKFCHDNNDIADQLANWGRINLKENEHLLTDMPVD